MNIFIEYNEQIKPAFQITMNMKREYDNLIYKKNYCDHYIPIEVIQILISYLDYYSMLSFLLTSRSWNNIRIGTRTNHNTRIKLRDHSFFHKHNYRLCVKTTFVTNK